MSDTEITREDALAHFGVKGMKWGQRSSEGSASSSKKKPLSPGQKTARNLKVGSAAVLVVGTAAAIYVATRNQPFSHWSSKGGRGKTAIKGFDKKVWDTTVSSFGFPQNSPTANKFYGNHPYNPNFPSKGLTRVHNQTGPGGSVTMWR